MTEEIAKIIRKAWSTQARLLYATPEVAVWVGLHDPAQQRVLVFNADNPKATQQVDALTGTWLLVLHPGTETVQQWFDQHGYLAFESGNDFAAVAAYGLPRQPLVNLTVNAVWKDVQIKRLNSLQTVRPGVVIPLAFSMQGSPAGTLKLSFRLLDPTGQVVARIDKVPDEQIRAGLLAPPDVVPGLYTVVALLYDTKSLIPIPDRNGQTPTVLTMIRIENVSESMAADDPND